MAVNWDEKTLALLEEQWAAGLTASRIAALIPGASRSAIIGKVHRLRLARRREVVVSPKRVPPSRTVKMARDNVVRVVASEEAPMPRFIAEVVEAFEPVEYLKLESHHCRWLLDQRGSDGLRLSCGKNRVNASSYCRMHDRINQPGRYASREK